MKVLTRFNISSLLALLAVNAIALTATKSDQTNRVGVWSTHEKPDHADHRISVDRLADSRQQVLLSEIRKTDSFCSTNRYRLNNLESTPTYVRLESIGCSCIEVKTGMNPWKQGEVVMFEPHQSIEPPHQNLWVKSGSGSFPS